MTPAERAYLFDLACSAIPCPVRQPVRTPVATGARRRRRSRDGADLPARPALDRPRLERGRGPPLRHLARRRASRACSASCSAQPAARDFIVDWEERARRVIAEFRADTARAPDDPALAALVAELRADSADFARLWDGHAVATRDGGARRFRHPEDGILAYEQVTLVPSAHPDHKIVMLLPSSAAPSA